MKTLITPLLIISLLVLLQGCAGSRLHSSVESYSELPEILTGGTIHVIPMSPVDGSSLQWRTFRKKFEAGFVSKGFVISDIESATYVAAVAYGIDGGVTEENLVSTPVYGQVGGGNTVTHKDDGGWVVGSSTVAPAYGVVDTTVSFVKTTSFNRYIKIDITEKPKISGGLRAKVYEGKLKSNGSCGMLIEVIDEMIESFFLKFPKESGKVTAAGVFNC